MRFKSQAQRKAIMAKLRAKGFKQKPIAVGTEGKFTRIRVIHPSAFKKGSFRTIPAGKDNKGGTRLIVARPLKSQKSKIQAILIPK